jgi:outer membrane protein TolC
MKSPKALIILLACSFLISPSSAQRLPFVVEKPKAPIIWRPYKRPTVPPVQLTNSDRIHALIRAGKLYLTVQDAIAVAIENNLDLEVDRYGPLIADWNLERLQAGGPLRGVTGGNTLVNQAASGQGVLGAQLSAGLISGGTGGGQGGGGAIISQIGPVTQNLDPVLQNITAFQHATTPQPNPVISQTTALINTRHVINSFVQQGLLTGGYVQISANESYLKENTPSDILNPSVAPVAQIYIRHNLLNSFGTNVNSRFIRVARKGTIAANETFRSQLLNLVANVLNLYWDLVSNGEDLRAKRRAHDVAEKFYEDTKQEIGLGVLPKVEIYRAEAEYSARRQELAISQANVHQQENLLKNALSRNGMEDPLVDTAEVVPLDRIQVPQTDDLPPLRQLVAKALAQRPDVALAKINDESSEISAIGTANGLLPALQTILSSTASGLSGTPNPQAGTPDPNFVGGLGNALGQIFHRNFANRRAALLFQGTIGNSIAQGDYGVEQLQLRQGDLVERRNLNQLVVDISNQMIALRQARARYSNAIENRALQEQLLEKEQQKFSLGSSTIQNVISVQRSLATAESVEVAALATYSRARVALDQVLGQTLEANHVSLDEALKGRVARESRLPEVIAPPR